MTQTSTETIALTIDGRSIEARAGQMVLEICREAGIHVPSLCHDPRLEPYGGCRLCLVQIEGVRGFPTSCTTLATDGMVVATDNPEIAQLRRSVVELLLSDHELRCLSCDSAGACALQDIAYEFGIEESPYQGEKHRVWEGIDDNGLIERDYTKCISCGRCVRICNEVQGCNVYGYTDRGFEAIPNTPYAASLEAAGCEFCGQCVSTCPVGALTDAPGRYQGRVWETTRMESICGYCGVGCTVEYRVKDGRIISAGAPLGRGVNAGNLCAKGRYGWSFTHHPDRLTTPLVRRDGELVDATWDEALGIVAEKLARIRDEHGPDSIAGLASAKCTNEENYLFQKLMRTAIGTHNVDHCARLCHSSTVAGLVASFGSGAMTNSVADLGQADVILVIGSNTTEAHPIVGIELKRAA
ncbi:MAG: molybdopterin-dependent oxidoreductase, partial [Coriobacteriia bacterium]|nr:molybdopterin-dependent oxidoreductase [Coriobacteriia bacterium]